jgi:hypothetical protein
MQSRTSSLIHRVHVSRLRLVVFPTTSAPSCARCAGPNFFWTPARRIWIVECADKNLYVFRTEGVVMLKKATNRHGASSYSLGGIGKIVSSSKIGTSSRAAQKRSDCLAGHVRFELRNVAANIPLKGRTNLRGSSRIGDRDYSRLSCATREMQLWPRPGSQQDVCADVGENGHAPRARSASVESSLVAYRVQAADVLTTTRCAPILD